MEEKRKEIRKRKRSQTAGRSNVWRRGMFGRRGIKWKKNHEEEYGNRIWKELIGVGKAVKEED